MSIRDIDPQDHLGDSSADYAFVRCSHVLVQLDSREEALAFAAWLRELGESTPWIDVPSSEGVTDRDKHPGQAQGIREDPDGS